MAMHKQIFLVALLLSFSLYASASMYGFTTKATGTLREQRQQEEQQLIPRIQVSLASF
jgi:hypothetical protein